jgi:hypothetical protein
MPYGVKNHVSIFTYPPALFLLWRLILEFWIWMALLFVSKSRRWRDGTVNVENPTPLVTGWGSRFGATPGGLGA